MASSAFPLRWLVAAALASSACGLTLDLEPDEDQATDAGTAGPDAGPRRDSGMLADHGFVDARPPADLSVDASDVGLPDEPDGGAPVVCFQDSQCAAGQYCRREGTCIGPGLCTTPGAVDDCVGTAEEVVCGCDFVTHRNACTADLAGVSVALEGSCPDFGDATRDWCALAPPAETVGCVPCYDDTDCIERTTTAFHCVGSTCSVGGAGACAFNLPAGDCYYDHHCDTGQVCQGSVIRGCEDPTGVTSSQGSCVD